MYLAYSTLLNIYDKENTRLWYCYT